MKHVPIIRVFNREPIFIGRIPVITNSRVTILLEKDCCDWTRLEQSIWEYYKQGVFLTLITDRELPERIVWAASYSENNILQINLNISVQNFPWVQKLIHLSNNCGLFTQVCFKSVTTQIKVHQVIDTLDRIYNSGSYEVILDFKNLVIENVTNYIQSFLYVVNLYCAPRKILVHISI